MGIRLIVLVLAGVLCAYFLTGCGGETTKKEYPEKPLNLLISFAPGGGTDYSARTLLPYVEKELDMPITISFKTGQGGWSGWKALLDENIEGYTLAYINTPNIITGYLNPETKSDKSLDDFELIANHVLDYGVIAIRPDDSRFVDLAELMRYAQDKEVMATTTGYTSDDNIAQLKINQRYSTKFVGVHFRGASQGIDSVIQGHVDVIFANVGELYSFHRSGQLKVVAVMSKSRSELLPDVLTMEEVGYGGVYSYSTRGIAVKKGVDPSKVGMLVDAFEAGINNPDHIQKMRESGLLVKYMKGMEYKQFLIAEEENIREIAELLGWDL